MTTQGPTSERQRYLILDALRGFALTGIAIANYPEFALWTFLSDGQQTEMATGGIDQVVHFFCYMLVDGKFYSIFSILFGVGFALFLERHPVSRFLRRMVILAAIGFCHLMFIWSGDILMLYAVGGMLLPLFFRLSDKVLLAVAVVLTCLPVALDALTEFAGIDFAGPFYALWWRQAYAHGITGLTSPLGCAMPRPIPRCWPSSSKEPVSVCGSLSAAIACRVSWGSSSWAI